jgi:hypothetical protein
VKKGREGRKKVTEVMEKEVKEKEVKEKEVGGKERKEVQESRISLYIGTLKDSKK